MKKLLIICAAVVFTGCSTMGSGSGSMQSGAMGTTGTTGASGSGMDSNIGNAGSGYRSSDITSNLYFGA